MMGAFERNFEEQLTAARMLMEAPGIKVHVLGIAVSGENGWISRSSAKNFNRQEAAGVLQALKAEVARVEAILGGKAGAS